MVFGHRFLSVPDRGRFSLMSGFFPFRFRSVTPPAAAVALGSVMVLAACQANPADAPEVDPESTTQTHAPASQPPAKALREITVGVDPFTTNLNPHLVGNHDPVVAAIADLTLPSVFISGSQGKTLDSNFVTDVKTDDDVAPTKVTYTLNPAAQWSDGTPITISDFQYLASVVSQEPTAAGKSLYSHVKSISDGDEAGSITVRFDGPFTAWKEVFQHLLPSHIYQAEGQSFGSMMDGNSAASAGAYAVKSINDGRGIVELQRNDRYWGRQPAKTDILRFSTVPNKATGAQMLRTEQIQAYRTRPNATTDLMFAQLSKMQVRNTTREVQMNLVLNQASPRMADRQARQRVMDVVNKEVIAEIVEGSTSVEAPSWNVVPTGEGESDSRYSGTGAGSDVDASGSDEKEAESSRGDSIVLGAATDDPAAIIAARTAVDQLNRAGISATVRTAPSSDIFGTQLPEGELDGVVTWQASPSSVADYMDQFSCDMASVAGSSAAASPTPSATASSRSAETSPRSSKTESPTTSQSDAAGDNGGAGGGATAQAGQNGQNDQRPYGGNVGSICSPTIDRMIQQVSRGDATLSEVESDLTSAIARQSTVLPILADSATVAVLNILSGPTERLNSWPVDGESGVLVSAPSWTLSAKPGHNADGDSNETTSEKANPSDTSTPPEGTVATTNSTNTTDSRERDEKQ